MPLPSSFISSFIAQANQRLPVILCVLVLSAYCSVVAAAPDVSEETLAKRRLAISQSNETQRQELVRKYDAYRQLTESDRQQLRKLHEGLESNRELQDIMKQYIEWLKNLDVTQREQLRQAETPEQKRNLVIKFRAEQLRQKSEMLRDDLPLPDRRLLSPLSSEDLKTVMTALEGELIKQEIITKEKQAELAKLPGTQRYKFLMNAIGEYRRPKEGTPRRFSLPDPVLSALADVVQNPDSKKKIQGLVGSSERGPFAQGPIFMILRASTLVEARREFSGPDASALKESLFQSLKPELQARYSQFPLWQQELKLMELHGNEIMWAFNAAGDFPMKPPGDRGQPGRLGPGGFQGNRPRDGGLQSGFREGRTPQEIFGGPPPDRRRPSPERDRDGGSKK